MKRQKAERNPCQNKMEQGFDQKNVAHDFSVQTSAFLPMLPSVLGCLLYCVEELWGKPKHA